MPREIRPGPPSPSERPCERHGEVRDFSGQRVGSGPCLDREGRTVRHPAYVVPGSRNRLVRRCAAAALLLPLTLIGLYFVGRPARGDGGLVLRTALAPGPAFSRHSTASTDCTQCHQTGRGRVEDARCERCHDVPLSARLSNAAHVFQSAGDTTAAIDAPVVACVTCHVEHRGADAHLADVDDRECGACHRATPGGFTRLTSLTRHPEFAIVREGVETGSGLRWFNHKMHVPKVRAKFQKTCEACHQRAPGAAAFAPISFRSHCAECHEADLTDSAGTMASATLAALGPLPSSLRPRQDLNDAARQGLTGVTHADPWLLSTVQALRATIDPARVAADRVTLDRQVAQLELRQAFGPPAVTSGAWTGLESSLRTDSAPAGGPPQADEAVRAAAAAVETFAAALAPLDPAAAALQAEAATLQQGAPATPRAGVAGPAGAVEPLRQLLVATMTRAKAAGNDGLAQRANALITRLDALPAVRQASAASPPAGLAPLLQDLAMAGDPRVRAEAWRLNDLARIAQQQTTAGIDPHAFDLHRQQMLRLLDTTRQTLLAQRQAGAGGAADSLLARVSALRQSILAADYGTPPAVAAARDAFFRNRQIDRARVDTELESAGLRLAAPAEPVDRGQELLEPRLAQLRRELLAIGRPARLTPSLTAAEARRAIAALLGTENEDGEANALQKNRCTMCHELTSGGDQLAPVRAVAAPLLIKARFTHERHVTGDNANCETCHTRIQSSTGARDLNLPGVASCMTCHAPGKQAAKAIGCESCHRYHVPSTKALVWTP